MKTGFLLIRLLLLSGASFVFIGCQSEDKKTEPVRLGDSAGPTAATSNVKAVTAGDGLTCLLKNSGAVSCFGSNIFGRLGIGSDALFTRSRATPVNGLSSGVTAIAAGSFHVCALLDNGSVKCWGGNMTGQLGTGDKTNRNSPTDVTGLGAKAIALAAGSLHTCVLTEGRGVKCWGTNATGQLGTGSAGSDQPVPIDATGLGSSVAAVSAGATHTCALLTSGNLKCWGTNVKGEIGIGTFTPLELLPKEVNSAGSLFSAIATGNEVTCALTTTGGIKAWGNNVLNQLGDGTTTDRSAPVDYVGLTFGVTQIALARGTTLTVPHACALMTAGNVKCWGKNGSGQVGDGSTGTPRTTPVDVVGLSGGVTQIAVSENVSCAVLSNGGLKCWGENGSGQVGDGTVNDRATPVDVVE